jgi:hypothetical protein
MLAEEFELSCLESTLRTMQLQPTGVLGDEGRLPANKNDLLLHWARPTWIGRDYAVGGVLLLGKNPAGGSSSNLDEPHPLDSTLAAALSRLWERQDIEVYRNWRDVQLRVMNDAERGWRVWRISAMAIRRCLGVAMRTVAFGNLVPFRTLRNSDPLVGEIECGWKRDISHVVALLEPKLIVYMGANIPTLYQYCTQAKVLPFHRANSYNSITAKGKEDLRAIQRYWTTRQHEPIR